MYPTAALSPVAFSEYLRDALTCDRGLLALYDIPADHPLNREAASDQFLQHIYINAVAAGKTTAPLDKVLYYAMDLTAYVLGYAYYDRLETLSFMELANVALSFVFNDDLKDMLKRGENLPCVRAVLVGYLLAAFAYRTTPTRPRETLARLMEQFPAPFSAHCKAMESMDIALRVNGVQQFH